MDAEAKVYLCQLIHVARHGKRGTMETSRPTSSRVNVDISIQVVCFFNPRALQRLILFSEREFPPEPKQEAQATLEVSNPSARMGSFWDLL